MIYKIGQKVFMTVLPIMVNGGHLTALVGGAAALPFYVLGAIICYFVAEEKLAEVKL